jgi:hypothetical protein
VTSVALSVTVLLLWFVQLFASALYVTGPAPFSTGVAQAIVTGGYATLILLPLLFYADFKDTSRLLQIGRNSNASMRVLALCVAVPVVGSSLVVPGLYIIEYVLLPVSERAVHVVERIFS